MRNYNSADASLEKKKKGGEQNRTPFESNYISYGFISTTPAGLEEITICRGRRINSAGISGYWRAIARGRAVCEITPTLVVCWKSNCRNESAATFKYATHKQLQHSKSATKKLRVMVEMQLYLIYKNSSN